MNELFPFKKKFIQRYPVTVVRKSATLDWTLKVVCETCNSTWMSEIENNHALPAMKPLILGELVTVDQSQANAISLFAFKTAVLLDRIDRTRQAFFSQSVRYGFRESHAIPLSTRMFLAGFAALEHGNVKTVYHDGKLSTGDSVQFYVCTFAAGHLVFQVVSLKNFFGPRIGVTPRNNNFLAVPFWPSIPYDIAWPLSIALRNQSDFDAFGDRWHGVFVRRLSG